MMKKVLVVFLFGLLLMGFEGETNSLFDGNVTEKESTIMQAAWCDYNQDRNFIKSQCE